MSDLFTSLLETGDPIKLGKIKFVKQDNINKCVQKYTNQPINKIIIENVSNTSLFNPPIKANKSLIRNTIFIIYLFLNKKNDYQKLKQTLFKSVPSIRQSSIVAKPIVTRQKSEENILNRLLKTQSGGVNANKDVYKDMIKELKKENKEEFTEWFCKYIFTMHSIKNSINKSKILKQISQISNKNEKNLDNDTQKLIKTLKNIKNTQRFGDIYNYILILGLILYKIRILDINLYDSISDQSLRKDFPYSEYLTKKTLKSMILFILNQYIISDLISFPVKDVYTNFNKVINADDCYSNLLNYTFYFRYALSLYNIPGNNKDIYQILGKGSKNQIYTLRDLADVTTNVGQPWLQQLSNYVGYKGKKLDLLRKKRGNLYFWESNNYLILSAEVKKNNIKISSIGTEVTQENKIKRSQYDTPLADVTFVGSFLTTNKSIEVKCLTANKSTLGTMQFKIEEHNNETNVVIYIDGKLLYNVTKRGNKYCLYRLCGGITGSICIVEMINTENGLTLKTKYTLLPIELIIGFITGLIIENNDKMGKIIDKANSKVLTTKGKDCDSQIYTEQFIKLI